jgi:hypothetical protein
MCRRFYGPDEFNILVFHEEPLAQYASGDCLQLRIAVRCEVESGLFQSGTDLSPISEIIPPLSPVLGLFSAYTPICIVNLQLDLPGLLKFS